MPYELEQHSPRLWFVVNVETGKKHEGKPISLKKAKAQLRILKSAEVKPKKISKSKVKGGVLPIQYLNMGLLFQQAFPDGMSQEEMDWIYDNISAKLNANQLNTEDVTPALIQNLMVQFNRMNELKKGGSLKATKTKKKSKVKGGALDAHNEPYIEYLKTHPDPYFEYKDKAEKLSEEISKFAKNANSLRDLTALKDQLKTLTDKKSPTQADLDQIKNLATQIRSLNLTRSTKAGDPAIEQQRKKLMDEMVQNDKDWREYCKGRDDCINAFVKDGAASLWQWLKIDDIPQDTPYDRGRYRAAISLRANWPYTEYPKSKIDQALDVAKDSFEVGAEIAKAILL